MQKKITMTVAALALSVTAVSAQTYQRRATMTGNANANEGKCTIEVVVDGAAEVTIQGDYATIRNLSGQTPQWRRFECNRVMPNNPADFRFRGIDGRGSQDLVRSAQGGGPAVIRIEDRDGGAEGYTFDVMWSGGVGAYNSSDRYGGVYNDGGYRGPNYSGNIDSQRMCEDAIVREASRRFNTNDIRFVDFQMVNDRARRDRFEGRFEVSRGGFGRSDVYSYACTVNERNGRVQAQIGGRDDNWRNDRYGSADRSRGPFGSSGNYASQSCERAVEDRLRRDGYQNVSFSGYGNRSNRNDAIHGTARGDARYGSQSFDFTCSVNSDGSVRSVDLRRR